MSGTQATSLAYLLCWARPPRSLVLLPLNPRSHSESEGQHLMVSILVSQGSLEKHRAQSKGWLWEFREETWVECPTLCVQQGTVMCLWYDNSGKFLLPLCLIRWREERALLDQWEVKLQSKLPMASSRKMQPLPKLWSGSGWENKEPNFCLLTLPLAKPNQKPEGKGVCEAIHRSQRTKNDLERQKRGITNQISQMTSPSSQRKPWVGAPVHAWDLSAFQLQRPFPQLSHVPGTGESLGSHKPAQRSPRFWKRSKMPWFFFFNPSWIWYQCRVAGGVSNLQTITQVTLKSSPDLHQVHMNFSNH